MDCARLVNSLQHFDLSKSEGGKKTLSARELNSYVCLPLCSLGSVPNGILCLCFTILVMEKIRKKTKFGLFFQTLLIASSGHFPGLQDLSTIGFLGFATFQGRKHVLSWRNQAYSYSQFSYLLPVLTRKTILLLLHISLSVLISLVEIFSLVISVPWEVIFHRNSLFSLNCQHCCNFSSFFPPTFIYYKILVLGPLVISLGSAFIRHISGHAISTPSTICAMPWFGFCWKPISELRCSDGWKTSYFLTVSISDDLISICSHASSAFCFNSSVPSFEFTSPKYLYAAVKSVHLARLNKPISFSLLS